MKNEYVEFTDEQRERARLVDLADFLRAQGETLVRSGDEWRWKRHDSVTIRDNCWCRHSTDEGGDAVDFVRQFYNMNYPEAVTLLLERQYGVILPRQDGSTRERERKEFVLPPANSDMRRVFAYLLRNRLIAHEVISHFAHAQTLYEDRGHHNAVFVGTDEHGVPRHAHKRSTNSKGGSFRINVGGSQPQYSFRHVGGGDTLFVFEAPIDLLSFVTLFPKDWKAQNYITLAGVSEHAMLYVLEQNPQIKNVRLCLDHDAAGIEATYRLAEKLAECGQWDVKRLRPLHNDWNEDLKAKHGLPAQPAEEHPKLEMYRELCQSLLLNQPEKQVGTELLGRLATQLPDLTLPEAISELCDRLYGIAGLSLSLAQERLRQLGTKTDAEALVRRLQSDYKPHRDRGRTEARLDDILCGIRAVCAREQEPGVKTTTEKQAVITELLSVAKNCVQTIGAVVLDAADQTEEETQSAVAMAGIQ